MVPKKSNTPMAASKLAALTCGTPKSRHIGIRCTWIRPLVLAPQMKNVPNRIQNTRVFAASRNAPSASAMTGALLGGGRRRRLRSLIAEWPQAHIAGPIAHHQQRRCCRDPEHDADQRQRDPPAHPFGEAGGEGQGN